MALILTRFYSDRLTECNSMDVVIPEHMMSEEKLPVLWLLPPAGMDHTAWQRHTDLEDLAESENIIIISPDMKLSYGVNMVYGFDYFGMLTEELPKLAEGYFPCDLQKQMIAGSEEGAYVAIRTALLCPEKYSMAVGLSGASLVDDMFTKGKRKNLENAFGTRNLSDLCGTKYDLQYLIESRKKGLCEIIVEYSKKDRFAHSVEIFENSVIHAAEKNPGINVHIHSYENGSNWLQWCKCLKDILKQRIV